MIQQIDSNCYPPVHLVGCPGQTHFDSKMIDSIRTGKRSHSTAIAWLLYQILIILGQSIVTLLSDLRHIFLDCNGIKMSFTC